MSKENKWRKGPTEAPGEYWVTRQDANREWTTPKSAWLPAGSGIDGFLYYQREAAPERPAAEKPKIEPVAGRWYVVRGTYAGGSELSFERAWVNGDGKCIITGEWDPVEILAEIPSPEEYLEKMEAK